jgi:hypothetical protein
MNPKIFYMGRQLRTSNGRFSSFKTFLRKVWYWTKVVMSLSLVIGLSGAVGAFFFSTSTVTASAPKVQIVEASAPILQRIADCESGNGSRGSAHQFNADGSVVMHQNFNNTVDVGEFQLNMNKSNLEQMAKLGLNPLTKEGNEAFAKWLYANVGTSPWSSSMHCWAH